MATNVYTYAALMADMHAINLISNKTFNAHIWLCYFGTVIYNRPEGLA